MAKHALLSASGAHRWLECTPSALLELQFPQITSEYAEEGTAAHELCELTARYFLGEVSEMDFENRRDELAKGSYYNAEMQECANDYARFVAEKTKTAQESCEDAFTELEVRVDFSKYVKDGFGTGDCIIVADKVLEIVDFKYGKGVRVEATGNPQMRLYALGALLKYNTLFDIDSVRMTIFQPRLSGVQSSDEITVKELLEWAEKYVKPRANGIKELKWKADKSLIGQPDKQNMTVHRWFANKSCPGTYLYERHAQIASEVNKRLGSTNIKPEPEKPSGGLYRVQTGAFKSKANADAMLAKVKAKGFDTYMVKVGDLYKIQVGAFKVKANAEATLKKLQAAGFSAFITTEQGAAACAGKSVDELAREVLQGKWGNGAERKKRLEAAGYDYVAVQKKVNQLA